MLTMNPMKIKASIERMVAPATRKGKQFRPSAATLLYMSQTAINFFEKVKSVAIDELEKTYKAEVRKATLGKNAIASETGFAVELEIKSMGFRLSEDGVLNALKAEGITEKRIVRIIENSKKDAGNSFTWRAVPNGNAIEMVPVEKAPVVVERRKPPKVARITRGAVAA